jgi:ribosome-associated toxin RatA of RatAB toxin-antitoxin module
MSDQATLRARIPASPARCFAIAADVERYPEWARDVKEVRVLRRDEQSRPLDVEFRTAAMGRSTRYVLRYDHEGAPGRLGWRLVDGDIVERLDGTYRFDPVAGDLESTAVTYHLVIDLKAPLPAFVKRRAEARILSTALRDFEARVTP